MEKPPLILFDGLCNLCEASVLFVIKRDPKGSFRFTSLQSEVAGQRLTELGEEAGSVKSLLLIKNGRLYNKSDAALEIVKDLSGFWSALQIFRIIPKGIRDLIYDWIARNRYRWFGKKDVCLLPTSEILDRFLEE